MLVVHTKTMIHTITMINAGHNDTVTELRRFSYFIDFIVLIKLTQP